jgi:hypothetical protein
VKVTVIEQVEHSADITAEMLKAYLVRRGWALDYSTDIGRWYDKDGLCVWVPMTGAWHPVIATDAIRVVSVAENRKPHEVLADIEEGR